MSILDWIRWLFWPPENPPSPTGQPHGLAEHNRVRSPRGLAPFDPSAALIVAARDQARECAIRGEPTHEATGGVSFQTRIQGAGYYGTMVAENAAEVMPGQSIDAAFARWMASPGHRANILGPYEHVGCDYADAPDGRRFWVACYGRRD